MIALNAPRGLVRRLVLAGTMPSVGEGTVRAEDLTPFVMIRDAVTEEEQRAGFLKSFFAPSERSQAAGEAAFQRIYAARRDRTDYVGVEDAKRQGLAFMNFQNPEKAGEGSFGRLAELKMPVLIANGEPFSPEPRKERLRGTDKMLRQRRRAVAHRKQRPHVPETAKRQRAAAFVSRLGPRLLVPVCGALFEAAQ